MFRRNLSLLCVFSLLSAVLFSSCRFDYEETIMAEDLSDEVPQTILINFSQVMVKNSVPTFYIEAAESSTFEKKKETLFKSVSFKEFDKDGEVVTSGSADNARMYNETESVELWGNLDFYSKREDASLTGEYLFWDNEKSTLTGKSDDQISIVESGGSEISGKGFSADSKTKSISFSSDVSGSWVNE